MASKKSAEDSVNMTLGANSAPGPRLFDNLAVSNLLSFGGPLRPLKLLGLNVLVGPNGAGKSNLLEVIALLRSTPANLAQTISKGGGIREWLWKGGPKKFGTVGVWALNDDGNGVLSHCISLMDMGQHVVLATEAIDLPGRGEGENTRIYDYSIGRRGQIRNRGVSNGLTDLTFDLDIDESILGRLRDPFAYPEITFLADEYSKIRLYREWAFGRNTIFREPQRADLRTDRLEEDFSNLGLVLNRLSKAPRVKADMISRLRDLYEGLGDFGVSIEGGTVQVYFNEGDFTIPATRLSDGSLRYLCLLAILCDPEPPPLVCIEEPELGLHPDLLPKLADLLVEASKRTQLIVTTHSDILIDALSDQPESVVVCEKHDGQTTMKRLDREELGEWLDRYRLGELWTRGHLGGTRW